MLQLIRTTFENEEFQILTKELDIYLAKRNGEDHSFYNQFNELEKLNHVVIAKTNGYAIACGALKIHPSGEAELKRMYCIPEQRRQGISEKVLAELEQWSRELKVEKVILETGKDFEDAVRFYLKNNYKLIPNFPPYQEMENSVCMMKQIT